MSFGNLIASNSFSAATAFTRAEEGGFSIRADDGGNWTGGIVGAGQLIGSNMGVSAPILVDWLGLDPATAADTMRDLPVEVFETIARGRFWSPLACAALDGAVALMVFDFGWNAGVARSSRLLQTVVGMSGRSVDGEVGDRTLSLVGTPDWPMLLDGLDRQFVAEIQQGCGLRADGIAGPVTLRTLANKPSLWPTALARRLAQAQMEAYRDMRGFAIFGAGWEARTTRRLAAALALGASVGVTLDA